MDRLDTVRSWIADRSRVVAAVVAVVGVGLAVVRMARIAADSSHTQYADYWPMLDTMLADDGTIRWSGVLESRHEHPIAVAKLLYLLNVELTNGDNHGQAAIVILLGLVLVGLVALMARATPRMGTATRVAMVVLTAFVVFAPQGSWSYVKAMSGTAWLAANVFVLGALAAQQRGRVVVACALGVVGCLAYGTGLAVWPALVVAGVLLHGRRWQAQWPVWAAGAATLGVYLRWFATTRHFRDEAASDPVGVASRAGRILVGGFAAGDAGTAVGVAALAGAAVALWACRDRLADVAPWVGTMVFAATAAMMIGRTRGEPAAGAVLFAGDLPSRYWTIVAWAWIGLAGLAVVALRDRAWRAAVPVALALIVLTGGRDVPAALAGASENQDLVAVGMHIGVADGARIGGGFADFPAITDRAREIGHQPFDGSFDMGCGLLGEAVEVEPALPEGARGSVRGQPLHKSPGVLSFVGAVAVPGDHVECVVVVDAAGTVVGTGPTRNGPHGVRLRVIAPAQYLLTVAVRLEPGGPLYAVPIDRP